MRIRVGRKTNFRGDQVQFSLPMQSYIYAEPTNI